MKTKFITLAALAAAVLALAACNKDPERSIAPSEIRGISFGTYAGRSAITRAGTPGNMDNTLLQSTGFGVFAYHHDASAGETGFSSSSLPNFMYNQEVTYSAGAWSYTPVRYWPNEHGSAAASDNVDKVSFFAYAPYVAAGSGTEGITALSANDVAGDPKVTYKVAARPEDNVDLVWAVTPEATSWVTANGGTVNIAKEMPYLDLIKPKTNGTINFLFKHATAKLGMNVVGVFDEGSMDSNTKITIASVTVKGQFARQGVLNLNNTEAAVAKWESKVYDDTENNLSTIVVNSTNNLRAALVDGGNVAFASQPAGVTAASQNLLADNVSFNLIPGDIREVVIDYYVTTNDAKLAAGYSRVQNTIRHTFATPLAIDNNKSYTLNLQLGMTSVKVSATVDEWEPTSPVVIDLPANVDA